jgi:predicted nuclease of predicted toxin-antitoxin system
MRLLADENVPLEAIRALRSAGHDVYSATESAPGAPDSGLLERARSEGRLVVTFDLDFGNLVVRNSRRFEPGVLLLRLAPTSAAEVSGLLLELLARADIRWAGHLSILDRTHLRQRPI